MTPGDGNSLTLSESAIILLEMIHVMNTEKFEYLFPNYRQMLIDTQRDFMAQQQAEEDNEDC